MPVRPLNKELAEVARVQLNENPTRVTEGLCFLKEWIRKEPHLKARTDDQWLLTFLRGCKFSLERTKEKIDLYYSLRSTAPDLYCIKYTDPKVLRILDAGVTLVLPKTVSPTAPRVLLFNYKNYDNLTFNVMESMAVGTLQQQICYMEDDNMIVNGIVAVLDFKDTKLSQFIDITPMQFKKIVTITQEAAPVRMKSLHVLNAPPFFGKILNIVKPFLSEKNKSRLHIHNHNLEDFYNYVPKHILPIEYGGNEYTIQEIIGYWKNKFQQYQAWFEEDLEYGTVESLRSGPPNAATMFGVDGSFRQLELD